MHTVSSEPKIDADVDDSRAWWFFDSLAVILASFDETGQKLTFVEGLSPGGRGSMPPLHVHPDQEEAFYILEGSLRLYVGRDTFDIGPGQFRLAPRGIPHTFEVASTGTTRCLTWITGPFDEFVRDVGRPATELRLPTADEEPPVDPDELTRLAALRGITILGPPGMLPTELPEFADGPDPYSETPETAG